MLTLIVPCAGRSTRFGNGRPKPFLTHPNGNLMLIESINGLDLSNVDRIIITVVEEHIEQSKIDLEKIKNKIFELKGVRPEFLILPTFTKSQSETVYKTIKILNIKGSIFIKDCDNYFNATISDNNFVCISILQGNINSVNKSYVCLDKFGQLAGIVEKSVIGNKFCVGGYSFKSSEYFADTFEKIKNIAIKEIYISHIIQQMLLDDEKFQVLEVNSYCDWGTLEDWIAYIKQFKTIFIDLDGVLVINSSEYFQPVWGESEGLNENIDLINKLYDSGKTTIVITTSRKEEFKEKTLDQLNNAGIKYHQIIFNLLHAERILINDYSNTNPYPSAIAICLKRNDNSLKDFIK